jgi:hypothetical protein
MAEIHILPEAVSRLAEAGGVDLSKTEDSLALTFVERHGGELR